MKQIGNNNNNVLFDFVFQEELVSLKDIPNSMAVFCLATYGEGDPTDNAMDFYEWLMNGDADLTGVNYAVSEEPFWLDYFWKDFFFYYFFKFYFY